MPRRLTLEFSEDNNEAYLTQPVFTRYGEDMGKYQRIIITKELFLECYKRWIIGNEEVNNETKDCKI